MVAGRERYSEPYLMGSVRPTFDLVLSGTIVLTGSSHAFSRLLGSVLRKLKMRHVNNHVIYAIRASQVVHAQLSSASVTQWLFTYPNSRYIIIHLPSIRVCHNFCETSWLRQMSRNYSTAQTYKIPQIFHHHQQLQVSERLTAHSVVTFARSSTRLP